MEGKNALDEYIVGTIKLLGSGMMKFCLTHSLVMRMKGLDDYKEDIEKRVFF